jgi:hypothetical protein
VPIQPNDGLTRPDRVSPARQQLRQWGTMDIEGEIPGLNTAKMLLAANLADDAVVDALVDLLGLVPAEAKAALDAARRDEPREPGI